MAAISSLQIGNVIYDIYAKSAQAAPVASHTISSHSDSAKFFSGNSAKSACSATSAKNAGTATSAGTAANVNASTLNDIRSRYILLGENKASTPVVFNSDLSYNPDTNVLNSPNIKSQYISASSGIYLNNPDGRIKYLTINGGGISGNDGIYPVGTSWENIIESTYNVIGVDLKKYLNEISVNTNGIVADSANNDFVIGSSCWVSGYSNFGGGKKTKTKGHQNFTFGISSLVYDGSGTMSLGQTNSALQVNYSFVGGQDSIVETYSGSGSNTTTIVTESDKRPSFAFGYGVSAKGGAVVFGNKNFGMGENSSYLGKAYTSRTINGSQIASLISQNYYNWYSEASPSGGNGGPFVVGSYNWGYNPGTFVAGISSVAIPPASFVACKGNVALSYAQTVIGKYNYPEESLFTIGAGYGDSNRRNVFSITNDGKFFIGRGLSSDSYVNSFPEFYVGDTLILYGNFNAGNISSSGGISAQGAVYTNGGVYANTTITSNYFLTYSGRVVENLTASNFCLYFGNSCPQDSTYSSEAPKIMFYGKNQSSSCSAALAFSYYNTPSRFDSTANMKSIAGGWFDFTVNDGGSTNAGVLADCFSATSGIYNNLVIHQVGDSYTANCHPRGLGDYWSTNTSFYVDDYINRGVTDYFFIQKNNSSATITMSSTLEKLQYQTIKFYAMNVNSNTKTIFFINNTKPYTVVSNGNSAKVAINNKYYITLNGSSPTGGNNFVVTTANTLTVMYCEAGNVAFLMCNY